ncbi:HD domain-containing protein [Desulfoplanes formicivorans]|uniref:Phosphohydrolase n=1 Tax=Desulfoplanes formicivorans TaxID=1592317 RepID=A0A194ACL7_9BACT|nr:HD domain-containing protein [Desulfoplanes formicivorans]GAU07877.1 phosphohydrolase [Desulfoplanes formicivorans]
MPGIRKSLLQLVFSGTSMRRWNDKMRPMELMEVDKQAHKMIMAWMLYMLNGSDLDRKDFIDLGDKIVLGGMYDYLYRLVITDIKPPVFYQIKANPAHYQQLTQWVLEQLKPRLQSLGDPFWKGMREYYADGASRDDLASRILDAAHLLASQWEFHLIKDLNPKDEEMDEIEANFIQGIEGFQDLIGVRELMQGNKASLGRFAQLCGQLRFQQRWSQTPRIPETAVLGHMFIVACYGYFFTLMVGGCKARRVNNFFAGLFHDVPELLTRDIISPVKSSVKRIGDLIKEYEFKELDSKIFRTLEQGGYFELSRRLKYFLGVDVGSEFASTICLEGDTREVEWDQLQTIYNNDDCDPKDGFMLKICDDLAAFIEAYTATRNGITNDQLQQALWKIRKKYQQVSLTETMHIGGLLADFD